MSAIEVGGGNAVLSTGAWETEFFFEDGDSVGTCDAGEGIEEDFEVGVGLEEFLDEGEVEDIF